MQIGIGPMLTKLQRQLKGKISKEHVTILERDHREISRLYVRGYLNQSGYDNAGRELSKRIEKYVAEFAATMKSKKVRSKVKEKATGIEVLPGKSGKAKVRVDTPLGCRTYFHKRLGKFVD